MRKSGMLLVAVLLPVAALAILHKSGNELVWAKPGAVSGVQKKPLAKANLIRVDKSDRVLHLLRDDLVIATYPIALGGNPTGHKQQEGDQRTPEGRYIIDWRNPKSGYFLSLHISYPNKADLQQSAEKGVSPGGDIMIHGQLNGYGLFGPVLQNRDWTLGCIAVTNDSMQEIWDMVPDGTPIEISA